jgi:hypothetical protein
MASCDQFRQILRQDITNTLIQDFGTTSENRWFLAIGKIASWPDDTSPPQNIDCIKSDTDMWRTLIGAKRLGSSDVCLVVRRVDWEVGKIYTSYDDQVDLFDDTTPADFYALVDEERVYKCIDNAYDTPSTVAPTHTDSEIRLLSDGYRWKFLYRITEATRKFLTTSTSGQPGYMPVEFVTSIATNNDDRELQWNVQQAAVDGSIDHIRLDQNLKTNVVSDRVLFFDTSNQIIGATSAGATQLTLGGSGIIPQNGYYNNMLLRLDSGLGAGQQRVISNYTYNANNTATATLERALDVGVTGGTGTDATLFSILPNVRIVGDGTSYNNSLDTQSTRASVTVKFTTLGITGATAQRYLDSFDMADVGQNYTFATATVVAGLTFARGVSASMANLATPVMSPPGGHGVNPVKELGSSALMIVTELNGPESSHLAIDNDYRQFALIKNPELVVPYYRLVFTQGGLSGSFTVGATASQGATATSGQTGFDLVQGKIVEWSAGASAGAYGGELVVTNVTGGAFALNGLVNSLDIAEIYTCRVAGDENRNFLAVELSPVDSATTFNLNHYRKANVAIGTSLTGSSVTKSSFTGRIHEWELNTASNSVGTLHLEYAKGTPNVGEVVSQIAPPGMSFAAGYGKVVSTTYAETVLNSSIYDQTHTFDIKYDGSNLFTSNSFALDRPISFLQSGAEVATGYVVNWTSATGSTNGTLRVATVEGSSPVAVGQNLIYTNSTTSGSQITAITSTPTLKYHTGEVMHIQNLRPIERSTDQTEEFKFIVEF